jgi:hypothetical protein
MTSKKEKDDEGGNRPTGGVDESRLALHGASSGGAAMIALKSHHICGEIGGGGLDYPRRRLARRPPSAIGLGPLEEHD